MEGGAIASHGYVTPVLRSQIKFQRVSLLFFELLSHHIDLSFVLLSVVLDSANDLTTWLHRLQHLRSRG